MPRDHAKSRTRRQLESAYQNLSAFDKGVVQLCSILYEPVTRTNLLKCLKAAQAAGYLRADTATESVSQAIKTLDAEGVLVCDKKITCNEAIVETVTRDAVAGNVFADLAGVVRSTVPLAANVATARVNYYRYLREFRIGLYAHDIGLMGQAFPIVRDHFPDDVTGRSVYVRICGNPFDAEWFQTLSVQIQAMALTDLCYHSAVTLTDPGAIIKLLRRLARDETSGYREIFQYLLASLLVIRGDSRTTITRLITGGKSFGSMAIRGSMSFLRGDGEAATRHFESALKSARRRDGKRQTVLPDLNGIFFILALLKTGDTSVYPRILKMIDSVGIENSKYHLCYASLKALMLAEQNMAEEATSVLLSAFSYQNSLSALMSLLVMNRIAPGDIAKYRKLMEENCARAQESGYQWVALEFAGLLSRGSGKSDYREIHRKLTADTGMVSIAESFPHREPWDRTLTALAIAARNRKNNANADTSRLAWIVNFDGPVSITPREQKQNAAGDWSHGRQVSLKRIKFGEVASMTPQDHQIAAAIMIETGYYSQVSYAFNMDRALPLLAGHPLLFLSHRPDVSVELVREDPMLVVERAGRGFQLRFAIAFQKSGIVLKKETSRRYKVILVRDEHVELRRILGPVPLKVPAKGKDRVIETISGLSNIVTVHSVVGGNHKHTATITGDSRIYVHLYAVGDGFRLEFMVRPFRTGGPYFRPGDGGKTVYAAIDGARKQAVRNLAAERQSAADVIKHCPHLDSAHNGGYEWHITDQESCLSALVELQDVRDRITVEWPEGEKFRIRHRVSHEQLAVSIRRRGNWFEVVGKLQIGDETVADMRQVIDAVEASTRNFVALGDGDFVVLTDEFRRRLNEFSGYAVAGKDAYRVSPVVAAGFQDFLQHVSMIDADDHWRDLVQRIEETQNADPVPPVDLQADLRDYQLAGFRWAIRLANWGVGACLADDMGLGKTLQALAVILDRAAGGPSLVVAPSSVCHNWSAECSRFAPSMRAAVFTRNAFDGDSAHPGAMDLVICSYGLLVHNLDTIRSIKWRTIVLDEAQAIKNSASKRSQAVMKLDGDFKMITTGTPLENHLFELWNLFRFLNPGLLGSREQFRKRYAVPIERDQDDDARTRLKKLIHPFLLRRTKKEVLRELPPKTEVMLQVDMTDEETAFYEALRRTAIERLQTLPGRAASNHIHILAEITRLRRACCHPRLVVPDTRVKSSKLALFLDIVEELRENRHRILVFSQFVDYLTILRGTLDKREIAYQYLDGGTPMAERARRVERFQSGAGELFLISLKAGGVGLNLTAADYVIHMDPWWNPAVEDQASDRAHRIGQIYPVTIYRLLTRGTIEEKIVKLHHEKRDLAAHLLDGAGSSRAVSAEDLVALIRDEHGALK